MNIYPAMRAHMGRWDYFIVKMNMRELAESVKFAHDIYEDKTLDEAIQRVLNTSRVKKDIVTYLSRQEDRFFASVVVAAMGGNPNWLPVFITDDDKFALFRGDERLNKTFGVLTFDGTQQYYALDGQHRLAAIKSLLDSDDPAADIAPPGFAEEEISVLVVVPTQLSTDDEFLKRYRRLFGNLNRYAKAMDQATNIIMDEDDAFAIITRRLISEHEFFRVTGRQRESFRIKTTKGKNLKSTDPFFTSIETLYEMNRTLLNSRLRRTMGWIASDGETGVDAKEFAKYRPRDETLDALFAELRMYWDGILAELPVLRNDPLMMRNHQADPESDDHDPEDEATDHLLFWPIGQQMFAPMVRDVLDVRLDDPEAPTEGSVRAALEGLGSLQWELHQPPWRNLMLVRAPGEETWKMRQEDRKGAMEVGQRLQQYLLGVDELDEEGVLELKQEWSGRLFPAQPPEVIDETWTAITSAARTS
jgi:DNA sulfur modification protein DndB